jgi:hypothetical protein
MPAGYQKNTSIIKSEIEGKYPGKYILDKIDYVTMNHKVVMGCKTHGDFEITPRKVIYSNNECCPECSPYKHIKYLSKEKLMLDLIESFPDIDFSKFEYRDALTKGIAICKTHGEFLRTPSAFRAIKGSDKNGCKKCGYDVMKSKLVILGLRADDLDISEFRRYKRLVRCFTEESS